MRNLLNRIFQKNPALNPKAVRNYYDQWHHRYLESFGHFFQSAQFSDHRELVQRIIDACGIQDGMKILDAGCGVGGPATFLAQMKEVEVDGITISKIQTDYGNKEIEKLGLKSKVNLIDGDFHRLSEYYSSRYDVIIFLESLVHSHNPDLVFSELEKVTKEGSVLYIKDLFKRKNVPKNEVERVIKAELNTNKYCQLKVRDSDQIIELAGNYGFRLKEKRDLAGVANHDFGNQFVLKNGIQIYEGEPVEYLEWAELIFIKE